MFSFESSIEIYPTNQLSDRQFLVDVYSSKIWARKVFDVTATHQYQFCSDRKSHR